jgi:subtilisin family serine protease
MATAVVSGIAALMYSANPSLTGSDVKRIILESTKLLDSELPVQSKGMVSAGKAVQRAVELKR